MRHLFLFPAVALAATLMSATPMLAQDDYVIAAPGSPSVPQGEHPQIRMESERVVLTLRADGKFNSVSQSVLVNDSDQTVKVDLGFPESNDGKQDLENPEQTTIEKFAASINGQRVNAKRKVVAVTPDYDEVWWVAPVTFAPRENKKVRVTMVAPLNTYGNVAFTRKLDYNFTGGHWKGQVGRTDLEVRVPLQGQWVASGIEFPPYEGGGIEVFQPTADKDGAVGVLRRSWRDWDGQSRVQISLSRTIPGWLLEPRGNTTLFEGRMLDNATSFRVGTPDARFVGDTPAFVQGGVTMVSLPYLAARAAALSPVSSNDLKWDKANKRATLTRGNELYAWRAGSKTLMNSDQPVKLRVAPAMFITDSGPSLYVPLAESARALGLNVSVDASGHRFSIGK